MSTNSIVGVPHEGSWRGRYVHWDGYPTAMVPALFAIVARDGYETAVRTLTADHHGWSSVVADAAARLARGEPARDPKRFAPVPGYGVAYTDDEQPDEWWGPSGNGDVEQWAYVLEPTGLAPFAKAYPERIFDVARTFSVTLESNSVKPSPATSCSIASAVWPSMPGFTMPFRYTT